MNAWPRMLACSLFVGALAAGAVSAQDKNKPGASAADKCDLSTDKPDEVKSAYSTLTVARLSHNSDDVKKRLKSAVEKLTLNPSKYSDNPLGHDYVLGEALVSWSMQPGVAPVTPRGELGYLGDKDKPIDLLATADSLFTNVEKTKPDCVDRIAVDRQMPWSAMINAVGPLVNSNQIDSAEALLKRSMVIYRDSPYTYYFQGQIATRRGDFAAASDAYQKAATLAAKDVATDTTIAAVKEFSTFSAAYAQLQAADKMTGDQQKAAYAKAAELYKKYLTDYPNGPNVAPAQAGLTQALKGSGDTTALASRWNEMVANPATYTAADLYSAAAQAFQANDVDLAVKLADAGEQKNPWLRQGLFNAANIYWKAQQYDKMLTASQRLVQIDPADPDNYQLLGIAYQGLQKASKDPKVAKAYSDSLNAALLKGEKLPVKVTFTEFTGSGTQRKLAGTVENLGAAQKSVTLKVDFLDEKGNVVNSQTTTVMVDAKGKKDFSLTGDGAGIAAYRYTVT